MTSTDTVEPKATIDTGLPWKKVVKGSRSSTRHTKKQVPQASARDIEAEYKSTSAKRNSEYEKSGVSVEGQHFAERVEHVPLKKRRSMVPSSSSLKTSSTRKESSQQCAKINHDLSVSRLNPNPMGGKSTFFDDKPDSDSHDFSGIKILAEVACGSVISSDIVSVVACQPDEPVQQQDTLIISAHVEANESSMSAFDFSGKDPMTESNDKVGKGKSEILAPSAADQNEENSILASSGMTVSQNIVIAVSNESSTERPKKNMEAGESRNLGTVSENISGHEQIGRGKNNEYLPDLNLPADVVDEVAQRCSDGDVTESVKESGHVDGSKDFAAGLITSDVHMNSLSLSGPKADYDSQIEDGELREPYDWEETEDDNLDVEQVDYGSEPENEQFYSFAENNENKVEDTEKRILTDSKCETSNEHEGSSDVEKHVVVYMNESHSKVSSPSRSFDTKPSHETISRRRFDSYKELSVRDTDPNKFVRRSRSGTYTRSRSPGKGQFYGWDPKGRWDDYKGGRPYGFGRPRPVEGRVMMNGFDHPGQEGPHSHGFVRRQFSNGGYRGRSRRFPEFGGGNHDFRGGDRPFPPGPANAYPSRMHHNNNRINSGRERSNSPPPVFRRSHYPQSRSRSRSRSPVSWNWQNRFPGFKPDENRMERVRLPFQKQYSVDQETGFQRKQRFFHARNNDDGAWEEDKEHGRNNQRGRNSPPRRVFRTEQRYDNLRRVNSDKNHFRPFTRHNYRFVDDGGSRGCKYERGTEDKNRNRSEMVHRYPSQRQLETMEKEGDHHNRRFRLNTEQEPSDVSKNNKKEAS